MAVAITPSELHDLQLALECKGATPDGRLSRIAGGEPDDIELVQLTRYADGTHRLLLREDASPEIADALANLDLGEAFGDPEQIVLALGTRSVSWVRGQSYVFPDYLPDFSWVAVEPPSRPTDAGDEPSARRPMFVAVVDGVRASYCCSSRENDRAAEAWVETLPDYRHRGLARSVVATWASVVRRNGKVAFYSHYDDNLASAGVARSLGLHRWQSYINFEGMGAAPS